MDGHSHEPGSHYDRVTEAWGLLLGEELHYGVFDRGDEDLPTATTRLTVLMEEQARLEAGLAVLDVGCGTGAPACALARTHGVGVTGITTSAEGIDAARTRAQRDGLTDLASFEQRDGMANGFPDSSFDRAWALESSHLMRDRAALVDECARVLAPGGRLVLCDIIRRRPMDLREVRRLREPLALLRDVFGDARMEPLAEYRRLMEAAGLTVTHERDLTPCTRATFECWQQNAAHHRDAVVALIGAGNHQQFVDSCDVLRGFWDDGTLGYGLIAADKPPYTVR